MKNNLQNNQQGSILLYSLMVISLITAISIIVSIIVVNQIKLTSGAANGTQAYYAAEAGIEKGLFAVRYMRDDPDFYLEDTVDGIDYSAVDVIKGYSDSSFANKASFDIFQASAETPRIENQEIKENEYVQIDYYDVDNSLNPTNEVVGITVQNSGDNPATWAEVSWTAWDSQGELLTSTTARKLIGPSDLSRENGWPINNLNVFTGDPVGYRVRIKALKAIPTDAEPGDLSSVTVIPYEGTPGESDVVDDLPSQVVIKSIGERGGFKQSLVASVPWKLPLFGLYDYVIFSESDIYKDIILNAPTYSSGTVEMEDNLTAASSCPWGPTDCDVCHNTQGWQGWCPSGTNIVVCYADDYAGPIPPGKQGTCKLSEDRGMNGIVLPVPDTIPEGDEYYLSLRMNYICTAAPASCSTNRDLNIELGDQSVKVYDISSSGQVDEWHKCTIPDSFSLGDPSLPFDDSSRILTISLDSGWNSEDFVNFDWYQLSTYKMFDDCY